MGLGGTKLMPKNIDIREDAAYILMAAEELQKENNLLKEMINQAAIDFHNHIAYLNPNYNATLDENILFYIEKYKQRVEVQ